MSSFATEAGQLAAQLLGRAEEARGTRASKLGAYIDIGTQALKVATMLGLFELDSVDDALRHMGLQRRASRWRPAMYFAAGALAGGAIAVLLTPKSGKDLRGAVTSILEKAPHATRVSTDELDQNAAAKSDVRTAAQA